VELAYPPYRVKSARQFPHESQQSRVLKLWHNGMSRRAHNSRFQYDRQTLLSMLPMRSKHLTKTKWYSMVVCYGLITEGRRKFAFYTQSTLFLVLCVLKYPDISSVCSQYHFQSISLRMNTAWILFIPYDNELITSVSLKCW